MEKVTTFTSRLAPLPIDNIDTDQIIPARFLKTISKAGLGDQLFYDWRYDAEGKPNPEFILNRPEGLAASAALLLRAVRCRGQAESGVHVDPAGRPHGKVAPASRSCASRQFA